jgi:hypothetical protein
MAIKIIGKQISRRQQMTKEQRRRTVRPILVDEVFPTKSKARRDSDSYFYVFSHYIKDIPVYDRSCTFERDAKERVKECKERGQSDAFYTSQEKMPNPYWY